MKGLLLAFTIILLAAPARSQNSEDLATVLQKIISDTAAFFSTYKGKTHELPSTDPRYHSILTIPGTFNNEITISTTRSFGNYFTRIADNITEKEAKALVEKWNMQLKQVLGSEYLVTEKTGEYEAGKPLKKYNFRRGKLDIFVFYHKYPGGVGKKRKNCEVNLYLFYSLFKT